jgi:hypothetical protein
MEDYPISHTDTSTSGLASTRSAASVIFGAPHTAAAGPSRAPSMNCGRKFEHNILTSDMGSIKAIPARAEFTIPGAPSLVYRKPSHDLLPPHAPGSGFSTHSTPTIASLQHDCSLIHLTHAWREPRLLP